MSGLFAREELLLRNMDMAKPSTQAIMGFRFSYFQGDVPQITEEDFRITIGERHPSSVEQLATIKNIEGPTEAALAAHLKIGKEIFDRA